MNAHSRIRIALRLLAIFMLAISLSGSMSASAQDSDPPATPAETAAPDSPAATEEATATETPTAEPSPTETVTLAPSETETAAATETATEIATEEPTELPATETATTEATTQPTETASATATVNAAADPVTTFRVSAVDLSGNLLPGACFSFSDDDTVFMTVCDGDDGSVDGVTLASPVSEWTWVDETISPSGYLKAPILYPTVTVGEVNEIAVQHLLTTGGTLLIHSINAAGDSLPGACFESYSIVIRVCDKDDGANDGITTVSGLNLGEVSLSEIQPPIGYLIGDQVSATITGSDPVQVDQLHQAGEVQLIIGAEDSAGNLITDDVLGACFYGMPDGTWCDGDDGSLDGLIQTTTSPGTYTFREYRAPNGYAPMTRTQVTITGPDPVTLVATHPAGGQVRVSVVDQDGVPQTNALYGACFYLYGATGPAVNYICDADDGSNDGVTTLSGPAGDYRIERGGYPLQLNSWHTIDLQDKSATIVSGQTAEVTFVDLEYGAIAVTTIDPNGNPLTGACYAAGYASSCDAWDGANDGLTHLNGLEPAGSEYYGGAYTVTQSSATPGYRVDNSWPSVDLQPGQTATLEITNYGAQQLTVQFRTTDGSPVTSDLGMPCVLVETAITTVGRCDGVDGESDGTLTLDGFAPGFADIYLLTEPADIPDGYVFSGPASQSITVQAGINPTVTFVFERTASLTITRTGLGGVPYSSCFSVDQRTGPVCDEDDGERDGIVHLTHLLPGPDHLDEWDMMDQSIVPIRDLAISLVSGPNAITISTTEQGGALHIRTVDDAGFPVLSGGLVAVNVDDATDRWPLSGLNSELEATNVIPPGVYRFEQSGVIAHVIVPGQTVTVVAGKLTTADVLFTLRPDAAAGWVRIFFADQFGNPAPGACIQFVHDNNGAPPRCDGAAAGAIAQFLAAGEYVLHQTSAGSGYRIAADIPFTVTKGKTIDLTLVNETTAVPVQVIACAFPTDGDKHTEITILEQGPTYAAASERGGCVPETRDVAFRATAGGTGKSVTFITDSGAGRADGAIEPGSYTIKAGDALLDAAFEVGKQYVVFVQKFTPYTMPEPPVTETPVVNPAGEGLLEILAFTCPDGGAGVQFVTLPPGEASAPAKPGGASNPTGFDAGVTTGGCKPGDIDISIDGGASQHVSDGVTLHNLKAGEHTLSAGCTSASTSFQIVSGQATKVLVLDYHGTCVTHPTATPDELSTVKDLPNTGSGQAPNPAPTLLLFAIVAGLLGGWATIARRRLNR